MDYKICRFCLTSHKEVALLKIFSQEGLDGLTNKIQCVIPFKISIFDQLPKYICYKCCSQIDQWYSFVTNSVKSNEILLKNIVHKGTTRPMILDKQSSEEEEEDLNTSDQIVTHQRHSLMIQRRQAKWVLHQHLSTSEDDDSGDQCGTVQDIQLASLSEVRERTQAQISLPTTEESNETKPESKPGPKAETSEPENQPIPMETSEKTEMVVKHPLPIHPSAFHPVPVQYQPYHQIAMYQQYQMYNGMHPNNTPIGFIPNIGPNNFQPNNVPNIYQPTNNGPNGLQPNNGPSGLQPNNGPNMYQPTNNGPNGLQPNNGPNIYQPTNNGPNGLQPNNGPNIYQPNNNGPNGLQPNNGPNICQPNNGPNGSNDSQSNNGLQPNNGPNGLQPNNGSNSSQPINGPNGSINFQPNTGPIKINNGPYQTIPFYPYNSPINTNVPFIPNSGPVVHSNNPYVVQNYNFQVNNNDNYEPIAMPDQVFANNPVPNQMTMSKNNPEMVPNCTNNANSQIRQNPGIGMNETVQVSQQESSNTISQTNPICKLEMSQESVKQDLQVMKNQSQNNYQSQPQMYNQNISSKRMEIDSSISQMSIEKNSQVTCGDMKVESQQNKENVVKQKYSDVVKLPLTPNVKPTTADKDYTPMFENTYNLDLNYCKDCNTTLSSRDNIFKHALKCGAKKKG